MSYWSYLVVGNGTTGMFRVQKHPEREAVSWYCHGQWADSYPSVILHVNVPVRGGGMNGDTSSTGSTH